jgi:AraC family transcriptional regulator
MKEKEKMKQYKNGAYLGPNVFEHRFSGLIISKNTYTPNFTSDWHFHENPYFAFILKGGSIEKRKKNSVECEPGMLLYYNDQEVHKNEKYKEGSQNFNVEFQTQWFQNMELNRAELEGGFTIKNPKIKNQFAQLLNHIDSTHISEKLIVEELVSQTLFNLYNSEKSYQKAPQWIVQLKEYLQDTEQMATGLRELGTLFGVHPVTVSRLFSHFYGCTISEYRHFVKVEKSFKLLAQKHIPLETIASDCGFSDHAHFSRVFKKLKGLSPSQYRKFIFG